MEIDPDELDKVKRVNVWLLRRLREMREAQGLTQAELGERMGDIDRSRISDTESGKYGVKLTTVLRFLHSMNIDFETFANGCPDWKSSKKPDCCVVSTSSAKERLTSAGFTPKQIKKIIDSLQQGSS